MVEKNSTELKLGDVESKPGVVTFHPPVYIQRYLSVAKILEEEPWKQKISKVVDFGCGELKMFKYLKQIRNITHIYAVDVDEQLILKNLYNVKPLMFEHISGFTKKLTVDLFCGSIVEPDERLVGVDAVICIELIEHLYDDVLQCVPNTVFKHLKPKLVIFTTPNADFNVLFDLKKFRHDDHKFEWTRTEFEKWCCCITSKYSNYDVFFEGIGQGPEGTEHLGCCSQMAVFTLKTDVLSDISNSDHIIGQPYKLLETVKYPFKEDSRNEEQKFYDEVIYRISCTIASKDGINFQRYDSKYEIPIIHLWHFLKKWCATAQIMEEKLTNCGFTIVRNDEKLPVLIYDAMDYSESESEEYEEGSEVPSEPMTEETWGK